MQLTIQANHGPPLSLVRQRLWFQAKHSETDVAPLGVFTPAMLQILARSVVGQKLENYAMGSETAVTPLGLMMMMK